jgi:hypothetical protein
MCRDVDPDKISGLCRFEGTPDFGAFLFTCPTTSMKVQHWLDDDDDATEDAYEGVVCQACARLHFVNRKTGKLLGHDSE